MFALAGRLFRSSQICIGRVWYAVVPRCLVDIVCRYILLYADITGTADRKARSVYQRIQREHNEDVIVVYRPCTPFDREILGKEFGDRVGVPWSQMDVRRLFGRTKPVFLPVVLHFDSLQRTYRLHVRKPMQRKPHETSRVFVQRLDACLGLQPRTLHAPPSMPYQGSFVCSVTSHVFMVLFVLHALAHRRMIALGVWLLYTTSVLYHGTGHPVLRQIDIASNVVLTVSFAVYVTRTAQWLQLGCISIIVVSYIYQLYMGMLRPDIYHALFLHVPTIVGFLFMK